MDNFYMDHRVAATLKAAPWFERIDLNRMVGIVEFEYCFDVDPNYPEDGSGSPIEVVLKWEVCPTCEGRGSHVNPSIDAHGLTAEDFSEDPDFREDYMRGLYDQPCNECHGRRVVPVMDPDHNTPAIIKQVERWERNEAQARYEHQCELRMGA